jgi:predicted deacylase
VPVQVPTGGVCCPSVRVGSVVERGQLLATIRDLLSGHVAARVTSPCDGVVFYQARAPLVNEQTLAFQIVPDSADEVPATIARGQ